MPSHPREMITVAERRFPVRIRLGVPPGGFGQRHTNITAWLDENCGADGWAITPSSVRGVLNDPVSINFLDVTRSSDQRAKREQATSLHRPGGSPSGPRRNGGGPEPATDEAGGRYGCARPAQG